MYKKKYSINILSTTSSTSSYNDDQYSTHKHNFCINKKEEEHPLEKNKTDAKRDE